MKKEVSKDSYDYKILKYKYPDKSKFLYEYVAGGYLNTDYTTYYDEEGKELFTEGHGNLCIKECKLDETRQFCTGCLRTITEIIECGKQTRKTKEDSY